MSRHLSPAQVLPTDVLRPILKWVVGVQRSRFSEVYYEVDNLRYVLSVCSGWRQAALELLWKVLDITIDADYDLVDCKRPWWLRGNALPAIAANLVIELHVRVELSDIVSGTAYKLLTDYIADVTNFPHVQKLVATIKVPKLVSVPSGSFPNTNVLEFSQCLKSMVPPVATTKVICPTQTVTGYANGEYPNGVEFSSVDSEEFVGAFVNSLCGGAKSARLDLCGLELRHMSNIDCIPQLSSLSLSCMSSSALNISLVHRNAHTLRRLSIELGDSKALLFDANDNVVIYPTLEILDISSSTRSPHETMSLPAEIVPLPVLRSLSLSTLYPYFNDVLFRGNSATLEYLTFHVDAHMVDLLNRSRVLEGTHKVLRHIVVNDSFSDEEFPISPAALCRFIGNLASAARKLVVTTPMLTRIPIDVMEYGYAFKQIRVYDTSSYSLPLFTVLSLLKALPSLVHLTCGIDSLGSELEEFSSADLPEYVASTYGNSGTNMQEWTISSCRTHDVATVVDYIMLLVLACANLRRIDAIKDNANYHDAIAKALDSGPFSKFESQLSWLLIATDENSCTSTEIEIVEVEIIDP